MDCNNYEIGKTGPMGAIIKEVILRSNTFIVYMDSENTIQWFTSDYGNFHENFGEIQNKVSDWESKTNKLFNKKESYNIKCILAEAYARILDDRNINSARDIINRAINRIEKQGKEILKQNYIITSLITTIIICIAIFIVKYNKLDIEQKFGKDEYKIAMTMLFGGIGAFVFTIIRLKDYKADIVISRFVHILDGLLRIFYGLIAALIIALAIKSNLLLGFLNQIDKSIYLSVFLGICAGASEVLIPSLIKQVEDKAAQA